MNTIETRTLALDTLTRLDAKRADEDERERTLQLLEKRYARS